MPLIIYDIFPSQGHYNCSLKSAMLLRNAGYDISYIGPEEYRFRVEKYGFNFLTYPYFLVPQLLSMKGRWNFMEGLYLWFNKRRINEARINYKKFKTFINNLNPDLVILDEHFSPKALLYKSLKINIVFIQTMPDPEKQPGLPPFTSFLVPGKSASVRLHCEFLWMVKNISQFLRYVKRKVFFLNQDIQSIYETIADGEKLHKFSILKFNRSFGIGIKGIPRIMLSPADFEFTIENHKSGCYQIGPLVDIHRTKSFDIPKYSALMSKINYYKRNLNGFVIYCSFGTQTLLKQKKTEQFFINLLKVAALNIRDLFILSTGEFININKLPSHSENVFVFKCVPQAELLTNIDIMISHGGLNSITECIFCEVPVLVYPLSNHWDQPGNSARVVYHKIGLRGKLNKYDVKNIAKNLHQLKTHYDTYKKNIIRMKSKFQVKNESKEIINIINQLIKSPGHVKKIPAETN